MNTCSACIYSKTVLPDNSMTCNRYPPTTAIYQTQGLSGIELKSISVSPAVGKESIACGEYRPLITN